MLQRLSPAHLNRIYIADCLSRLELDVDMADCHRCIAGHTIAIIDGSVPKNWAQIKSRATELLGLTEDQAQALFCPKDRRTRNAHDAARVVRYLAATDTVDWSVA